jgi:predicted negative regulator of RcsB-dependent stress response
LIVELVDRPRVLASLAFEAVADPKVPHRNFAFAESALDTAEKAPGSELHFIKAVRSVVRFESGKTDEGLKLIDEAIAEAEHAPDKAQYNTFKRVMKARIEEVQKQEP